MPKKTASARGGAQRNKPKVQKSIQLVRQSQASDEQEQEVSDIANTEPSAVSVSTLAVPETETETGTQETQPDEKVEKSERGEKRERTRRRESTSSAVSTSGATSAASAASTGSTTAVSSPAPRKGAATRLAAQRQAAQRPQQRAASLITAEHYAYVRKDLVVIAILAAVMFATIIILHFVPGIGS